MSEAAAFDGLAEEFFAVWLRFRPDAALSAGFAAFADRLPAQSDDDHSALSSCLETLIVALEEIDFQALDAARRIDLELMFALARVEHRELMERDWRHRDPLRFLPLRQIHLLTLVQPEGMREALAALLARTPEYLRLALAQLQPMAELVPPIMVAAAGELAERGRRYLRELARSRWLRKRCHGCGELETLAEAAAQALLHYADALRRDIAPRAAAPAGCGAEHLAFLLRHKHQLAVDPADCGPLLDALGAACTEEMAALAARLPATGGTEPAAPTRDIWRADCDALLQQLSAGAIVTPPRAELRIEPAPPSPDLQDAGAAYVPALLGGTGTLLIPRSDEAGDGRPSVADMHRQCLALGWGGAHLLSFAGGMAARALPRRLSAEPVLAGGWSLYLDALTCGGEPARKPAMLRRRQQAIDSARVDLALHTGHLGAEAAMARLAGADDTGSGTTERVARMVQMPGDALAAVLGWRLLDAAGSLAAPDERRTLHDRLLALGPVPVPLALRRVCGDDLWESIRTIGVSSHQ